MKHLKALNKYFFKYKWHLLLGILFVLLSNVFRIWQPRVIREALDLVLSKLESYKSSSELIQNQIAQDLAGDLMYFGGLVIILALSMGIFMYFMRMTIIVMSRLIEYDIRKELFDHYELLDQTFYRKNNTGDLMSRITEDVSKVRMYLGPGILYTINLVSLFVIAISSMLEVSVKLTLYALLPLPILSITIYFVSSLIHKKSAIIQKQLANLNSISQEVYSGIRVIKSYVQERAFGKYFKQESDEFKTMSLDLAKVNALFFPTIVLLIGISTIITVYIGGIEVSKGNITHGNIAEFVIYINLLTWPVTAIGWIASIVQQASASQMRLNEFLEQSPNVKNEGNLTSPLAGNIAFNKVSFTYPDSGIQAMNQLNFTLKKGEKLMIVGRTASGKSTIADLMVRMYDPSAGKISINDNALQEYDLGHLRKNIAYIPQDVFLFSDTVENNIRFGNDDASLEQIIKIAEKASINKEIQQLPEAYQTKIGERGVSLSGGQKQRISIARALLKNPDIIILDDCLSAVDSNTEHAILEYLEKALVNKTCIFITHRIPKSIVMDKIIVLADGTLLEEGTHDELLSKKGEYAKLYKKQSAQNEEIIIV